MSVGSDLDAILLRLALRSAVHAPSSHNSQPWRFHVRGATAELWGDPNRRLPVVDPDDRELTISCGAALGFLRVALHRAGYEADVEVVLEGELLARVKLRARIVPDERTVAWAEAIDRRHTNRGPYAAEPVALETLVELREAAEVHGAWLSIVHEPTRRERLANLIAEGDRTQWHNPAFRRELAAWMRSNRAGEVDGIPGQAIGLSNVAAYSAPLLVRTFDRGDGQAARDLELAAAAPVLAVLGTPKDDRRAWLDAGEALAKVLLCATSHGLAASFLNQPIEVSSLREHLRALIGIDGAPQLVLRIGRPLKEAASTPRRPVEDVVF